MANLALCQISSYYKSKDHKVGFNVANPDKVYISSIFYENKNKALGKAKTYPEADVYIGGSGINYDWLPEEMQKIKPDYDLYPDMKYSLGFTTRGCPRSCGFCIVRNKEGKFRRWQHIKEFYNPNFNIVKLLDNNILCDKTWFFENTDFIIANNLIIDITQGMDVRLLDLEISERLSELKFHNHTIHFAFDNIDDEETVVKGIDMLKSVGINTRQDVEFYVLSDFNTTIEEDLYRCEKLKELGANAFVMPYKKPHPDYPEPLNLPHVRHLGRWANKKQLFWSCDFWEYVDSLNPKEKVKIIAGLEENRINAPKQITIESMFGD